ncbi:MAG: hypothetical protein EOM40_11070 [Clostridia bacterium]|nr:hypothetical protein [Clostridia bacterium]NCC42502.1 hypothetical protein [Clostridia bacterium]
MSEKFLQFQKTLRPEVKLRISLEEYIRLAKDKQELDTLELGTLPAALSEKEKADECRIYREYLSLRRRAAWEELIRSENLEGLLVCVKEGWLTAQDAPYCMDLAARLGKRESQLWLLQFLHRGGKKSDSGQELPDVSGKIQHENLSKNKICREICHIMREKMQNEIPSLASALPQLVWKEKEESLQPDRIQEKKLWETDGKYICYSADRMIERFKEGIDILCRSYLHTLFHCLYLHMIPEIEGVHVSRRLWDLACDVSAEWALDRSGWFPLDAERRKIRQQWYQQISNDGSGRDTRSCYRRILEIAAGESGIRREETIRCMEAEFRVDSHDIWYETSLGNKPDNLLERYELLAGNWGRVRQSLSRQEENAGNKAGHQGGVRMESYHPVKKKIYDYRKFLKRFSVYREEMRLDMESFDYIPYDYGLREYGNILFLEPLETTEMNKLEEFVIAIDTSGSCSGKIVQKFLDETYHILSGREHFFKKMNVHIIQCDSMIQDHKKITCEEEWKAYCSEVKILGLGGTDFTPVFRLVDEMIAKKEIRNLKGLLYFTDGDGIYPRKKPDYETAFVFLNQALEKQKVPEWAIRLNLLMPEFEK